MINKTIAMLQTAINSRALAGADEFDSYIRDYRESIKFLQELELRSCDNCKHYKYYGSIDTLHITKDGTSKSTLKRGHCSLLGIPHDIGGCGDYFELKEQ